MTPFEWSSSGPLDLSTSDSQCQLSGAISEPPRSCRQQHGISCCYHGMVFDVDGTCLRVPFPEGEEEDGERYRCSQRHADRVPEAAHVFAGRRVSQ